jgi:hypothetical protein
MATVKVEAYQSAPLECSAGGDEIKSGEAWAMVHELDSHNMAAYRVVHFTQECLSVFNVEGTDSAVVMIGEVK